jgi:hypothetical protein
MALSYPRAQTVAIFVVCAIAVGATAWYVKGQSPTEQNTTSKVALAVAAASPMVNTALPATDWRAQFYSGAKSDSFKATPAKSAVSQKDPPLTATDILARNFMISYMQMHQAGLDSNPDSINSAANQMISNSISSVQLPRSFDISSIHTTTATDRATLTAYGNAVSAILNSYIPDQNHNEATLATQALDQNDMTLLKKIDPIIANYREAASALMLLQVPKPVAQYHLNLINGIAIALFNAKALRNLENDPLTGLAAISMEMQALQTMSDAQDNIWSYLHSAGVPLAMQYQ